ncbi:FAD-dependent oxidoreductase [Piscinibacter sakaiensis]|uniref:D-amino acid dehydrogenase, small subunit n=1 Tax=Piscinibacter sakaiensis TaxID=1547922 RepID=A0A0K8P878_PISS1|nr:FAD-dependent oxidoreductase [Piscinibacter sakaiensis]GAP38405.1 D-amino acid dehydrogenase, small subunit [Piscinibacter sakaiensis]
MRIAVIGAGIVGVTTAFELVLDGHEVTVYERRASVAEEGSFANAGMLAPAGLGPWAGPGLPGRLLAPVLQRHASLRVGGRLPPGGLAWLWRYWRSGQAEASRRSRQRLHRLGLASRERRHELLQRLGLELEGSRGVLLLLRRPKDLALAGPGLALLAELGVPHAVIDAEASRRIEPGLHPQTPLHAAIHIADDEVGNCRQFAQHMRQEAQQRGARFVFQAEVEAVEPGAPAEVRWRAAGAAGTGAAHAQIDAHDAVVVCAALGSRELLAPLGLRLPLLPVHGYSITAPMRLDEAHPERAPRSGVLDERYKVAITRLGQRLRVAGSAEIGGPAGRHHAGALQTLHRVLHDWYPGVAHLAQAQVWKGARPMLPDGPPVVGASGRTGVWLNLGHGASGWTLSNGSARLVADLIGGRSPAIDPEGLGVERLAA